MFAVQWVGIDGANWADSDAYRMGGQAVLNGADLYAVRTDNGFPFNYPPFAALLMTPLAMAPLNASRLLLTAASLLALAVVVLLLRRSARLSWAATGALTAAALAIEPSMRTLILGQINFILLAMVLVDLLVMRRTRGTLIGVAAGIKLTPAVFVFVYLLRRDWRACGRALAMFLATVAIGHLVSSGSSRQFWGGGFLDLGGYDGNRLGTDNQTLLSAVLRITHRGEVWLGVEVGLLVVGVGMGVAVAARCARSGSSASNLAMIAAIAIGGLLGSPVSWTHHWCSMIVMVAALLATGRHVLAGALIGLLWMPLTWATYTEVPFGELAFSTTTAWASIPYVLIGLLCLAWLGTMASHDPKDRPDRPMTYVARTD